MKKTPEEKGLQQKKDYNCQKLADEMILLITLIAGENLNDLDRWENFNGTPQGIKLRRMYNRAKRIKRYEDKTNE